VRTALKNDDRIVFPESIFDGCEMLRKRLACENVWQRGALAEAFELELEMAMGGSAPDSILRLMGSHAKHFTQAIAIALPLKVFLRYLVELCVDWVRSNALLRIAKGSFVHRC
jgi:hypothetical protein